MGILNSAVLMHAVQCDHMLVFLQEDVRLYQGSELVTDNDRYVYVHPISDPGRNRSNREGRPARQTIHRPVLRSPLRGQPILY